MHVHIHFLLLVIILKNYFCLAKKKPHILMLVADDWVCKMVIVDITYKLV